MEEIIIGLDTLWVLLGAALVFFMQCYLLAARLWLNVWF